MTRARTRNARVVRTGDIARVSAREYDPAMPEIEKVEQNTKFHKVRSFLVRPPRTAALLHLLTLDDDAPITLGTWEDKETWAPSLAAEVVACMEAHVTEEPSGFVRCKLAFVNIDGKELKALRLVHRQDVGPQSQYMSQPGELSGTSQSMVIQAQKHVEMALRLMAESQIKVLAQSQQITQHACDVANMLATRLAESEGRASASDARAAEFREMAEKIAASQSTEEKEKGLEDFLKIVQPMLPYVMQALAKVPPIA